MRHRELSMVNPVVKTILWSQFSFSSASSSAADRTVKKLMKAIEIDRR